MSQNNAASRKENLTFCVHVFGWFFFQLTVKNTIPPAAEVMQYRFLPYKLGVKLFTENRTGATALQNISHECSQFYVVRKEVSHIFNSGY